MKIKILIVPVITILLIVSTIWIILPKAFQVKEEYLNMKKSQQELSEMTEKIGKANNLSKDLTTNTEKQNILMRYLPIDKQGEDILNNLNVIAASEGAAISDLVLSEEKDTAGSSIAAAGQIQEKTDSSSGNSVGSAKNSKALVSEVGAKSVKAEITIVGDYEKIRRVVDKINNMKRNSKVASLKISIKQNLIAGESVNAANELEANITANFGYLKKVTIADVNSSVLDSGKFDMSVVDKILASSNTEFSEINIGQTGRTNPFIP